MNTSLSLKLGYLSLFISWIMPLALAQASDTMLLKIVAEPSPQAKSATITLPFGDLVLATSFPADASVDIGSVDQRSTSIVSLVWSDGHATSFPIHVSKFFSGQSVQLYFFGDSDSAPNITGCPDSRPSSIRESFQMFFACRRVTLGIETSPDNRFTLAHRRALNGWLIANHELYKRMMPIAKIGPYAFDPNLLDRLNEIKTDVDVNHYKEERFTPIRVADVRETLKLVAEEDIALAALIPQLIKQGRLDEAKQLNTSLQNPVKKLTEERGVTSVMGISPTLLESNARYIDTLQTRILN